MLFHLLFSTLRSNQSSLSCCEITPNIGCCPQWRNEYWLDRQVHNRRWKSMHNCRCYVYITLRYDRNWNIESEPKFWLGEIVEPARKTWVRCVLVCWWGNTRPNGSRSVSTPTRNRTADFELLLTPPFTQGSKCITLHSDPVHVVGILKIGCYRW